MTYKKAVTQKEKKIFKEVFAFNVNATRDRLDNYSSQQQRDFY